MDAKTAELIEKIQSNDWISKEDYNRLEDVVCSICERANEERPYGSYANESWFVSSLMGVVHVIFMDKWEYLEECYGDEREH